MDFLSFLGSLAGDGETWAVAVLLGLCATLGVIALNSRRGYHAVLAERANGEELIENLNEGIYRSSFDGRVLRANRSLVRLNGYRTEAELLGAVNDIASEWYVDPARRQTFQSVLQRHGRVQDFVSEVYRHRTRERIWVTESARIVYDITSGEALYYEGSIREITETVKRLQLEQRFRKLTSQLPGGLFQFSRDRAGAYSVPYVSCGFRRIASLDDDVPLATPAPFVALLVEEDRRAYFRSLVRSRTDLSPWDHEFRLRTSAGEEKWLRVMARPEESGGVVTWHGYLVDVSARRKQEMEIERLAYFDPLTGLPNRRLLMDRIAAAATSANRQERVGALLFIDLDNFKGLNDSQGHQIGDCYLRLVAERLCACVGERKLVARMGGDEFVVLIEDAGQSAAHGAHDALVTANQVLGALNNVFVLGPVHQHGSASIGVVVFDGSEDGADDIIRRADIAMYRAKSAGRNGIALFDPASLAEESERFRLVNELRSAIANGELMLHFQPQIDREGKVSGAEALLRWRHPELGNVSPDRFIPVAEQSGLIHELGDFVVARSIATLAEWQRRSETARLRLAINVSVQSFVNGTFVPSLMKLVAEHGVDASALTLEFTEHVMARGQDLIAARMADLKKLGIRFSLDDFGTGYSSLMYLKRLPFDEVKIDGSFVADIETRESDRALVRTILAMATTLGLTAVAEHVENEKQRIFLHLFGCELFQGFLYAPALAEAEFLEFVAMRGQADASERAFERRQQA